jgi:hypothetical protein
METRQMTGMAQRKGILNTKYRISNVEGQADFGLQETKMNMRVSYSFIMQKKNPGRPFTRDFSMTAFHQSFQLRNFFKLID